MTTRVKLDTTKLPKRTRVPPQLRNPNGRPVGSKNRTTQIVANLLTMKKNGELPHEFLLRIVRGEEIRHGKDKETGQPIYVTPTIEQRIECAKAAAPYFAPKLSTIEVVKNLTDDNLDDIIKAAAEGSGIIVDFIKEIGEDGNVTYVDSSDLDNQEE